LRQNQHAGAQDIGEAVRHQGGIARVGDQASQVPGNPAPPLGCGQQHYPAIGGDAPAIACGGQLLAVNGWKAEPLDRIVEHGGCGSACTNGQHGFDTQSLCVISVSRDTRQRILGMS